MDEDIVKIFDIYSEEVLFCKYFIAKKLKHNAEMGRCGERILTKELKARLGMLEFVSGFVVSNGVQSPQCDILVCKKNMYKRELSGGLFLVEPKDCIMVIEVKGNLAKAEIEETSCKNVFFNSRPECQHIKLALFAYNTVIKKQTFYSLFGYKYNRAFKTYNKVSIVNELIIDYFICLHREKIAAEDVTKQCMFIKDSNNKLQYELSTNIPVSTDFFNLIRSLSE